MRRRGSSIVVEYVPYGIGTKLKKSYVRIKPKPMRDQSASKQPRYNYTYRESYGLTVYCTFWRFVLLLCPELITIVTVFSLD